MLAACLGGCTTVQSYLGDPYVEPAKFQYLRCKDIATRILDAENRRVQLQALMDRAANGTGGKPGARELAGTLEANRVNVGRDGITPPM